eukprot:6817832-Prymnesium_polylepis.2
MFLGDEGSGKTTTLLRAGPGQNIGRVERTQLLDISDCAYIYRPQAGRLVSLGYGRPSTAIRKLASLYQALSFQEVRKLAEGHIADLKATAARYTEHAEEGGSEALTTPAVEAQEGCGSIPQAEQEAAA